MSTDPVREEITSIIRSLLARGFDPPGQAIGTAVECIEDGDPDTLRPIAEEVLAAEVRAREAEMASWPAVTDCDRLDAAFEELNATGILARHHWTCCSNCGRAEMPDEFERLDGAWNGVPFVGYTFYHQQDTETAADGGGVCLGYGSTVPADSEELYAQASVRVAERVRAVLERHGLRVVWDGTYAQKLQVPMRWQRRGRPRFCGE